MHPINRTIKYWEVSNHQADMITITSDYIVTECSVVGMDEVSSRALWVVDDDDDVKLTKHEASIIIRSMWGHWSTKGNYPNMVLSRLVGDVDIIKLHSDRTDMNDLISHIFRANRSIRWDEPVLCCHHTTGNIHRITYADITGYTTIVTMMDEKLSGNSGWKVCLLKDGNVHISKSAIQAACDTIIKGWRQKGAPVLDWMIMTANDKSQVKGKVTMNIEPYTVEYRHTTNGLTTIITITESTIRQAIHILKTGAEVYDHALTITDDDGRWIVNEQKAHEIVDAMLEHWSNKNHDCNIPDTMLHHTYQLMHPLAHHDTQLCRIRYGNDGSQHIDHIDMNCLSVSLGDCPDSGIQYKVCVHNSGVEDVSPDRVYHVAKMIVDRWTMAGYANHIPRWVLDAARTI